MTGWGEKLADVPARDLRAARREATDPKAIERLLVALDYKAGSTPAEMAEKYGIPRSTIYDWLDRFAERGVEAAADDSPPGREPELHDEQRAALGERLQAPPAAAPAWTPELVREHVAERFGVEHSYRQAVRLLHEAGLEPGEDGWRPEVNRGESEADD